MSHLKHLHYTDHYLETKRKQFLAEMYKKKYSAALKIYSCITEHAQQNENLCENDLKCLNQVQAIFKRFKSDLGEHEADFQSHHVKLARLITHRLKISLKHPKSVDYDHWKKQLGLSRMQCRLLYKSVMTFQLTTGCSNFCRRCNEWALPGIRKHFSFSAVEGILSSMIKEKNHEISLFGASDPLDWAEGGKTILDVVRLFEKSPVRYSLLTKVPKGKNRILEKLIQAKANLSVSVTSKNKKRVHKIQESVDGEISKQHDTEDLLIPAGLDEDFTTVKPSITDSYGCEITPEGAFIIIPAFTSALHPFGHEKIKITRDTRFFPMKKTGRHALLVDYFKPLSGYDTQFNHCHLDHLLDVQVESIILDNGEDELTPPGMRSTMEYLSIFDEKARLQRRKMTISVIRHLKKQHLAAGGYRELSYSDKAIYIKKIQRHIDLCRKEACETARLHTLSFFLASITEYLENNHLKADILTRLLSPEIQELSRTVHCDADTTDAGALFSDPRIDTFRMFRYFVCRILKQGSKIFSSQEPVSSIKKFHDPLVDKFIWSCPAAYDPVADLFVRAFLNPRLT